MRRRARVSNTRETRAIALPKETKMKTYEFWTDGGDQDDIQAPSLHAAARAASLKISIREWRDGAWGIVRGAGGQMDVPSRS